MYTNIELLKHCIRSLLLNSKCGTGFCAGCRSLSLTLYDQAQRSFVRPFVRRGYISRSCIWSVALKVLRTHADNERAGVGGYWSCRMDTYIMAPCHCHCSSGHEHNLLDAVPQPTNQTVSPGMRVLVLNCAY